MMYRTNCARRMASCSRSCVRSLSSSDCRRYHSSPRPMSKPRASRPILSRLPCHHPPPAHRPLHALAARPRCCSNPLHRCSTKSVPSSRYQHANYEESAYHASSAIASLPRMRSRPLHSSTPTTGTSLSSGRRRSHPHRLPPPRWIWIDLHRLGGIPLLQPSLSPLQR